MKPKLMLALGLLLSLTLTAQKVDLDRFRFTAAYRDLPSMPIDSAYHSYDFQLHTGPLMRVATNDLRGAETLFIEGWLGVPEHGDIGVSLNMEDLIIVKSDLQSREEIKKDKSGNITNRKTYHYSVLTYTYTARMAVTDKEGRQLQSRQLVSRSESFQHKGPEFASKAAAANLLLNMFTLTAELSQEVMNATIRQLSNQLTNAYGYAERRVSDQVWIIDSRKHPEYDTFRSHWAAIQHGLFRLNPNEGVEAIRISLIADIDYFEKLPLRYTGKDKADRKLRYAAYYLLSKIYYYLDDPDRAAEAANRLVLNDYDSRDGKLLEADASQLKDLFILNKRDSRHFPLYLESVVLTENQ